MDPAPLVEIFERTGVFRTFCCNLPFLIQSSHPVKMSLLKKLFKKKEHNVPLSVQFSNPRKASDPFLYENAPKLFKGVEYRDNEPDEEDLSRDQISPREVKKGGEYNVHVEMDVM